MITASLLLIQYIINTSLVKIIYDFKEEIEKLNKDLVVF